MQAENDSAWMLEEVLRQNSDDYFREFFRMNDLEDLENDPTLDTEREIEQDGPHTPDVNYRKIYEESLKIYKKIIHENVFIRNQLKTSEQMLLKVTRDRSFLLDRLHVYLQPELSSSSYSSSSETEETPSPSKLHPKRQRYSKRILAQKMARRKRLTYQRKHSLDIRTTKKKAKQSGNC